MDMESRQLVGFLYLGVFQQECQRVPDQELQKFVTAGLRERIIY
jgi:hypothetical protein